MTAEATASTAGTRLNSSSNVINGESHSFIVERGLSGTVSAGQAFAIVSSDTFPSITTTVHNTAAVGTSSSITTTPTANNTATVGNCSTTSITINDAAVPEVFATDSVNATNVAACTTSSTCSPSCVICMELLQDGTQIKVLSCYHVFHRRCIKEAWKKRIANQPRRCPICREVYSSEAIQELEEQSLQLISNHADATSNNTTAVATCSTDSTAISNLAAAEAFTTDITTSSIAAGGESSASTATNNIAEGLLLLNDAALNYSKCPLCRKQINSRPSTSSTTEFRAASTASRAARRENFLDLTHDDAEPTQAMTAEATASTAASLLPLLSRAETTITDATADTAASLAQVRANATSLAPLLSQAGTTITEAAANTIASLAPFLPRAETTTTVATANTAASLVPLLSRAETTTTVATANTAASLAPLLSPAGTTTTVATAETAASLAPLLSPAGTTTTVATADTAASLAQVRANATSLAPLLSQAGTTIAEAAANTIASLAPLLPRARMMTIEDTAGTAASRDLQVFLRTTLTAFRLFCDTEGHGSEDSDEDSGLAQLEDLLFLQEFYQVSLTSFLTIHSNTTLSRLEDILSQLDAATTEATTITAALLAIGTGTNATSAEPVLSRAEGNRVIANASPAASIDLQAFLDAALTAYRRIHSNKRGRKILRLFYQVSLTAFLAIHLNRR
jgi:hypothetical protein